MRIGVLLPAYNEEKNIGIVIKEAKRYLPGSEIVVVDDGSTDNTYGIARKSKVTVLRHSTNKGKGEALKTGFDFFRKSKVDCVLIADSDRQYSLKDAKNLIADFQGGYDVVTGYRNPKEIPYANRIGNFGWRIIFNILFHAKFKDTNCGFMVVRKDALAKIKKIQGGYIIENSILSDCVKNKLRVHQVPVAVNYGKRKITKFARMFFGVLFFIIVEGIKYRIDG